MTYTLFASKGCGSAIVEAMMAAARLPYQLEELDFEELGPTSERLRELNPLGQVPTLKLPNGNVMTESAAIMLHINDQQPELGLVPPQGDANRDAFWRWQMFLISALYPTFAYGDEPSRWVSGPAIKELDHSTLEHRKELWKYLEDQVLEGGWFLGKQFCALDIYLSVMSRWRPRRPWFEAHCPKLLKIAVHADCYPGVSDVITRNFG